MNFSNNGNYLEWYLGKKIRVAWDCLVFLLTFLPVIALAPASQPSVSVGAAQQPSLNGALKHSTFAGHGAAEAHFQLALEAWISGVWSSWWMLILLFGLLFSRIGNRPEKRRCHFLAVASQHSIFRVRTNETHALAAMAKTSWLACSNAILTCSAC